jgi:hypothetical protein
MSRKHATLACFAPSASLSDFRGPLVGNSGVATPAFSGNRNDEFGGTYVKIGRTGEIQVKSVIVATDSKLCFSARNAPWFANHVTHSGMTKTLDPSRSDPLPVCRGGLAIALWIVAVGSGLFQLWDYTAAPGRAGTQTADWPAGSQTCLVPGGANLIMFAHPHCPCTRASLDELAKVMTQCGGLVNARILFLKPANDVTDWEKTDLWRTAGRIPGASVVVDEAGREHTRFGVETSGHVLLYDATGKLKFSGGITSSRGHSGDNTGRDTIVELLRHGGAERTTTPVFGCPLKDRE